MCHNLERNPIRVLNQNFYLDDGQKLDKIVEFKRSFGSMSPKDWNIYTKFAKRIDVFLLTGKNVKIYEKNDYKIVFHTRKDLYTMLRKKVTPKNKAKIESVIKDIEIIIRGKNNTQQKPLQTSLLDL